MKMSNVKHVFRVGFGFLKNAGKGDTRKDCIRTNIYF